jgi:hypothetical protein
MFYAFTEDGTGRIYEVSDKAVPNFQQAEGWKTNIPFCYVEHGVVTMRLFLSTSIDASLLPNPPCQIFKLVVLRLRPNHGVEYWGSSDGYYLSLQVPAPVEPGIDFGDVVVFFNVDVPLNSPAGLNLSDTLEAGQLLGFGMEWQGPSGNCPGNASAYEIYGVEFFVGDAPLSGATLVPDAECDCSD